ncbi:MAG TPA: ubiquinol-cytochrome C chaperone family protein [Xanthobacteraceae bacterium]|nr:ubiquinol-cytochrome C chaperone family protein [Xanthobacteraceae bacterium]
MISFPYRRPVEQSNIARLYGAIVAQARVPCFYRDYGVPDTVGGRLDMIILHLVLLLVRLKDESAAAAALGQEVFDTFCRDIDDNFREMGVGDLAVPREMRRVGEAFYGRAAAYERALAAGDDELAAALTRNVFGKPSAGAQRLAAYVRETVRVLAAQSEFTDGEVYFPDPERIAASRPDGVEQP